jgi:hypothetical protein
MYVRVYTACEVGLYKTIEENALEMYAVCERPLWDLRSSQL